MERTSIWTPLHLDRTVIITLTLNLQQGSALFLYVVNDIYVMLLPVLFNFPLDGLRDEHSQPPHSLHSLQVRELSTGVDVIVNTFIVADI